MSYQHLKIFLLLATLFLLCWNKAWPIRQRREIFGERMVICESHHSHCCQGTGVAGGVGAGSATGRRSLPGVISTRHRIHFGQVRHSEEEIT